MNTDALRSHANFVFHRCEDGMVIASDMRVAAVEIEQLRAEVERLHAIVDRLPKTADGVPMVPGLPVWLLFDGKITEAIHDGTNSLKSYWGNAKLCYSTREAAEAARTEVGE